MGEKMQYFQRFLKKFMPILNTGCVVVIMISAIFDISAANAVTTTTSTRCELTSANPNNGYYIMGSGAPYNNTKYTHSQIPAVSTVIKGCASGTYHKVLPLTSPSTTSDIYGSQGLVYTCTSCATGYELQAVSGPFVYGSANYQMNCPTVSVGADIQTCVAKPVICTASNCASDTTWTAHSTGYVKRTARSCPSPYEECVETVQYACDYGYYGNTGSTSASGCSPCPKYKMAYTNPETGGPTVSMYAATTFVIGAASTESCYVKAEGIRDNTGIYTLGQSSNSLCYYDLGNCANWTAVCSTTKPASSHAVVSGTKTQSASGTYCWCNVNGKSFAPNTTAQTSCNSVCKNMCANSMIGWEGNAYTPMVSHTSLGC